MSSKKNKSIPATIPATQTAATKTKKAKTSSADRKWNKGNNKASAALHATRDLSGGQVIDSFTSAMRSTYEFVSDTIDSMKGVKKLRSTKLYADLKGLRRAMKALRKNEKGEKVGLETRIFDAQKIAKAETARFEAKLNKMESKASPPPATQAVATP